MKTRTAFGIAFTAGWLSEYYLDVDRGYARRVELRQQTRKTYRLGMHRLARLLRHSSSEAAGAVERVIHTNPGPPADDLTLLDRVKSEVFKHHDIPKGALTLDAAGGVVTVHGQVPDADEMIAIVDAIHRVPGVVAVRNLLHRPGTVAPNKAASLRASAT